MAPSSNRSAAHAEAAPSSAPKTSGCVVGGAAEDKDEPPNDDDKPPNDEDAPPPNAPH